MTENSPRIAPDVPCRLPAEYTARLRLGGGVADVRRPFVLRGWPMGNCTLKAVEYWVARSL